jgi:putative intracellular protease/amidase
VGEVKNNGTESAEFIQPFATFRDAQGAVVDTAFTYTEK